MKYKGFEIVPRERDLLSGCRVRGSGIYLGEKLMSVASDNALAKRVVDEKLRTGLWKPVSTV